MSITELVNSENFIFVQFPMSRDAALPNSGMHSEANSEVNDKIKDPQLVNQKEKETEKEEEDAKESSAL